MATSETERTDTPGLAPTLVRERDVPVPGGTQCPAATGATPTTGITDIAEAIKALRALRAQGGTQQQLYRQCYPILQSIGLIVTPCKFEKLMRATPQEQFEAIIRFQQRDGFGSVVTASQDFLELLTLITLFWKRFPGDAPRYMFHLGLGVWLI
jgi:hypothetical protein